MKKFSTAIALIIIAATFAARAAEPTPPAKPDDLSDVRPLTTDELAELPKDTPPKEEPTILEKTWVFMQHQGDSVAQSVKEIDWPNMPKMPTLFSSQPASQPQPQPQLQPAVATAPAQTAAPSAGQPAATPVAEKPAEQTPASERPPLHERMLHFFGIDD